MELETPVTILYLFIYFLVNYRALKYMKQKITELKGKIGKGKLSSVVSISTLST